MSLEKLGTSWQAITKALSAMVAESMFLRHGYQHEPTEARGAKRLGSENNPRSNRPERRMVIDAQELVRYKVDVAALSENRFSQKGQLEEAGAGCTFFWSGRPNAERRDACVTFDIRNDIVCCRATGTCTPS
ncbi:unnamed protein product [Schistocephalus solidus]|uniref:Uncharacterized protein n=1 Tax=Schistocephalus solidus TaxID=70667 RepID=A0A183SMM4_SCHSO|nr:unnamed protein product [Schistocephalus solidus]